MHYESMLHDYDDAMDGLNNANPYHGHGYVNPHQGVTCPRPVDNNVPQHMYPQTAFHTGPIPGFSSNSTSQGSPAAAHQTTKAHPGLKTAAAGDLTLPSMGYHDGIVCKLIILSRLCGYWYGTCC